MKLIDGAIYVVIVNKKKTVATYRYQIGARYWYMLGDEEKIPFDWVTKVIRRIRL